MAVKLEASDFAVAGAREGVGPVLGVDPQRQDLDPGLTGLVTSVAGIAGIVASAPLGPFLDRAASQGTALIVAVLGIAAGAGVVAETAGSRPPLRCWVASPRSVSPPGSPNGGLSAGAGEPA